MDRKLQIFISSTYTDLIQERQAAVEAILQAGHIPAGMELFSANNKSQFDVIKKWIKDSDLVFLILGGKYGSIEAKTMKSYIQLEYEYAKKIGKKPIAFIMSEKGITSKIESGIYDFNSPEYLESQYTIFKTSLMKSKLNDFFSDSVTLKNAIMKAIRTCETEIHSYSGWVKANSIVSTAEPKDCYEVMSAEHGFNYYDLNNCEYISKIKVKSLVDSLRYYTSRYRWDYSGDLTVSPLHDHDKFIESFLDNGYTAYTLRFTEKLSRGRIADTGYRFFINKCNDLMHMYLRHYYSYYIDANIKLWAKAPHGYRFINVHYKIIDVLKQNIIEEKLIQASENSIEVVVNKCKSGLDYVLEWDLQKKIDYFAQKEAQEYITSGKMYDKNNMLDFECRGIDIEVVCSDKSQKLLDLLNDLVTRYKYLEVRKQFQSKSKTESIIIFCSTYYDKVRKSTATIHRRIRRLIYSIYDTESVKYIGLQSDIAIYRER